MFVLKFGGMRMLKNIDCVFFTSEEEVKGKVLNCTVIIDKGSISFGFDELKIQFLMDQMYLERILREKIKEEIDCIWMNFENSNIIPISCKMIVNCESGATLFNLFGTRHFFGIKKGLLQKLLN